MAVSSTFLSKLFLVSACLILLFFSPTLAQKALDKPLQLLNTALHDTTFLEHAPAIQYPVVFHYQQQYYFQKNAQAPLELSPAPHQSSGHASIDILRMDWHEEKQTAFFEMKWNKQLVKLKLSDTPATQTSVIRAMKVRKEKKLWPSYLYVDAEI